MDGTAESFVEAKSAQPFDSLDPLTLSTTLAAAGFDAAPWRVCREWRAIFRHPDVMAAALLTDRGPEDALCVAAWAGRSDVVDRMLRLDGGVSASCRQGAALVGAAFYGHVGTVRCLLRAGCPADCLDGLALLAAAATGRTHVVRVLMDPEESDDPVRANCREGEALIAAAGAGHVDTVLTLLGAGEHAPAACCRDERPLMAAVANGHADVVRALLNDPHQPARADCHRGQALVDAAARGHIFVVEELLAARVHAARADCLSDAALMSAAAWGHETVVRRLLRDASHPADGANHAALVGAACGGHTRVLQALLASQPSPMQHPHGASSLSRSMGVALEEAAARGHEGVVRLLLNLRREAPCMAAHFRDALVRAAAAGHVRVTAWLGNVVGARDDTGALAVATAALLLETRHGRVEEVARLLAGPCKCDRFAPGRAMLVAASSGNEDILRLLLEACAPECLEDSVGQALVAAAGAGHTGAARELVHAVAWPVRAGCKLNDALVAAARGGHEETVRLLLDALVDARGATFASLGRALVSAACAGRTRVVEMLLATGHLRSATSACFALTIAAVGGHADVVRLMLSSSDADGYGALPTVSADHGDGDVLLAAAEGKGSPDVLRMLLQDRNHPASASSQECAAIVHALRKGNRDAVRVLLAAL